MGFFPGWDSVESTATIAHGLHVTAVIVLGSLFIAEGMALIYDSRNHRLVGIAESTRADKQKTKDDEYAAEVARLSTQLEQTAKQVADDRSLKNRIRRVFAAIDPQILREIDAGRTKLDIRMQPSDVTILQNLIGEPSGEKLLRIQATGRTYRSSVIMNGTLGPKDAVPLQIEVTAEISPEMVIK